MALFVRREPRLLRGCDERHEFSATAVVRPASHSPLRKFRVVHCLPGVAAVAFVTAALIRVVVRGDFSRVPLEIHTARL